MNHDFKKKKKKKVRGPELCCVFPSHSKEKKKTLKNCMWTMVTFIQGMSDWKAKKKKAKKQNKTSFLLFLYLEFSINQQFSVGALKYSVLLFCTIY